MRILIVCEHASARFGGEAILPLHYFRELRKLGHDVWLITHARTRVELSELFGADRHIFYVEDSALHRAMWRLGSKLPARIAYVTTGFVSRVAAQLTQRRLARRLVVQEDIDLVHQPIPVSPREPSMMFGLGAPVVIGPMNGAMVFPPAFRGATQRAEDVFIGAGRALSAVLNWLIPGKRRAAMLLVANERTRAAVPAAARNVPCVEVVENGVDLALWRDDDADTESKCRGEQNAPTFIFVGRLVDWKAVDLLLLAFQTAAAKAPMRLEIVGDGPELVRLQNLAADLGILHAESSSGSARFVGFLPQGECVDRVASADCLVLPSLYECGGAVVLEAMAMGKPVIATAWGGPADYLDSSCGVLIEPSGREPMIRALADAMLHLAMQPAVRAAMGHRGREKVARDFDWHKKALRMQDIYRSVITRGA